MILRPKRKEKGVGGSVRGAQSRPCLCSPPIEFGGMGKSLGSHTRNVACHPAAHRPAAPTDSASPVHQHLSYQTLMTLELALVARFLGETLAEACTSGAIPTHFKACIEHDCAVQGGEDDPTPV